MAAWMPRRTKHPGSRHGKLSCMYLDSNTLWNIAHLTPEGRGASKGQGATSPPIPGSWTKMQETGQTFEQSRQDQGTLSSTLFLPDNRQTTDCLHDEMPPVWDSTPSLGPHSPSDHLRNACCWRSLQLPSAKIRR